MWGFKDTTGTRNWSHGVTDENVSNEHGKKNTQNDRMFDDSNPEKNQIYPTYIHELINIHNF